MCNPPPRLPAVKVNCKPVESSEHCHLLLSYMCVMCGATLLTTRYLSLRHTLCCVVWPLFSVPVCASGQFPGHTLIACVCSTVIWGAELVTLFSPSSSCICSRVAFCEGNCCAFLMLSNSKLAEPLALSFLCFSVYSLSASGRSVKLYFLETKALGIDLNEQA